MDDNNLLHGAIYVLFYGTSFAMFANTSKNVIFHFIFTPYIFLGHTYQHFKDFQYFVILKENIYSPGICEICIIFVVVGLDVNLFINFDLLYL